MAAPRQLPRLFALMAGLCGIQLTGCVRGAALSPSGAPLTPCVRVVALGDDGASLVEERGAEPRYHWERPGERLQTLRGASPKELGLFPSSEFSLAEGAPPLERALELPGVGAARVAMRQVEDRFGDASWRLQLEREGRPPEVDWLYPEAGRLERVRWFRAGEVLWSELEGAGGCTVRRTDLRALAARALDADGAELLREGKAAEAEAPLRLALEVKPDDSTARYNLACALALTERAEEAMAALEVALSLEPMRLKRVAREDPDLELLRGREDFRRLVAPRGLDATP